MSPPLTCLRQNALALKTAALSSTKSLFQMASSLRKRLRNVEDFAPFLGELLAAAIATVKCCQRN